MPGSPQPEGSPWTSRHAVLTASPPPATPATLVCMVGPCRHYLAAVIVPEDIYAGDDKAPGEHRELTRVCTRWSIGEEHDDLGDQLVPCCTGYCPPWWSLRGRARQRENRRMLRWAHLKAAGTVSCTYEAWLGGDPELDLLAKGAEDDA